MALRIVTVDPRHARNWQHAKINGFWETTDLSHQLQPGDDVVFMTTGQDSYVLGQAKVTAPPVPRPGDGHHWAPEDDRNYRYRIAMQDFHDLRPVRLPFAQLKELGGVGRLNPVTAVKDDAREWIQAQTDAVFDAYDVVLRDLQSTTDAPAGNTEPLDRDRLIGEGDQREWVPSSVVIRRGRWGFRQALFGAYDARCAVTGCTVAGVLEGAHIRSYSGPASDHLANGLLLRADIHTLFDLKKLTIWPVGDQYLTLIAPAQRDEPYTALHRRELAVVPREREARPDIGLLGDHHACCAERGWDPAKDAPN